VAKKPQTQYERERRKRLRRYRELKRDIKQRCDRQSPAARRAAQAEYRRLAESLLVDAKKGYDAGHESGFWDAVLICKQMSTDHPAWVRDVLEKYARDRINGVPVKKRVGRPTNWLRDAYIYTSVNMWREESRAFGRSGKPRRFSFNEALKKVQEELKVENLDLPGLRVAYKRFKKRLLTGSYLGSPFLE
jgi:hypothetical protein